MTGTPHRLVTNTSTGEGYRRAARDVNALPPLVLHVIYHLQAGGLENGLVNLVNEMPADRYRHAIVCIKGYDEFRQRIRRPDIPVYALHKREGQDPAAYFRLWRLLRTMRPDILHSRTLGTLDSQLYGALAGVRVRLHGEHGRLSADADSTAFRHRLLRLGLRPFIHGYTAVSRDLADFLVLGVGIRADRVNLIYNGVDTKRFCPRLGQREAVGPPGWMQEDSLVIGAVGRLQPVKGHLTLVRAFLHLLATAPDLRARLRLVLVGDGPLLSACRTALKEGRAGHLAWLPGERDDIPEILRGLNVFVLPSLSEGTSNTLLEAMATGIPAVATKVGGNPELVDHGRTGMLVPAEDVLAMSEAICSYLRNDLQCQAQGKGARLKIQERFSIQAMISGYLDLYDAALYRRVTARL
jgi:sugar transferase (PEP-CTERM/EpsH1 system associated)